MPRNRALLRLRRLGRDRRGATAVEFALILPVLIVALVGLADYGLMVYDSNELENAARAGAQYALKGHDESEDDAAIEDAALAALPDGTGVAVAVSRACLCPDGTGATCGDECTDEVPAGRYVTVRLDRDYVPLFGFILDNPTPLAAEAKMRIQ